MLESSPHLGSLSTLGLGHNPRIGDEGALILASSTSLPRLKCLSLAGSNITDVGALALAGSANLDRLEHLDLALNRVGEVGKRALLDRFGSRVQVGPQSLPR